MGNTDLSFITVNYRTPELVDRLILSIERFQPPLPWEIVVVDNASGDNSVDFIRSRHPDVKLMELPKNIGFGGGNNRGAEIAVGRILVLINSDCEITEESFAKPVEYLDQHPEFGILGLKVFTPTGELEQSARGFPDPSTGLFGRSTFLGRLAQKSGKLGKTGVAKKNLLVDPARTDPYDVDWVAGTIMLVRRDCWDAVKGFDEGFFMYWEDADLCYRAKQAGFKTVYFPGANVIHRPGSSASRNPAPAIRYFHDSAYRYVVKHLSPGWSPMRAFAWTALHARAAILIAKARKKARNIAASAPMLFLQGLNFASRTSVIVAAIVIGLVVIGLLLNYRMKRIQRDLHTLGKIYFQKEQDLHDRLKAGLISDGEYHRQHDQLLREMTEETRRMTDGPPV